MKQISPSTFRRRGRGLVGAGFKAAVRGQRRKRSHSHLINAHAQHLWSSIMRLSPELRRTLRCMPLRLKRDCFRILHALIFYLQIFKERKGQYRALIAFSDAHSSFGTQHPWCLYIKDLLVFLQGERRELLSGYTI